jgi:hypothetical protein
VQWLYYSGKKKRHTIKYEVAVHVRTGRIIWISGPVPGSVHDSTLLQHAGLCSQLLTHELIIGDKGYVGNLRVITPFKSPTTGFEQIFNNYISKLRIIAEHTFQRIKNFHILKTPWNGDVNLHPFIFYTICKIVAIDVIFKPVY